TKGQFMKTNTSVHSKSRLKYCLLATVGFGLISSANVASSATATRPYKILNTAQIMGSGAIDYVFADPEGRRLYIPRGNEVLVFDLDSLKSIGEIEYEHLVS